MANTTASMLWKDDPGFQFAVARFAKEGHALGRKYTITLNGQWGDLNDLLEDILTGTSGAGYLLEDLIDALPNFSEEAKSIIIPPGLNVKAFARTPHLESTGEGDKAILTVLFEEGLQEGSADNLKNPVGPYVTDTVAFSSGPENALLPADTIYRVVFEPTDIELGYGLPFRGGTRADGTHYGYKWDLTIQAPHLGTVGGSDGYQFSSAPGYDVVSGGQTTQATAGNPATLLHGIGYGETNISLLAICNIWREGAITEQQRGALFCYLNDGCLNRDDPDWEETSNLGTMAYVIRILRGETQYRYYMPHVSVIRRYRSPPILADAIPKPGQISVALEAGAPPVWTGAPYSMYVKDGAANTDPSVIPNLVYKYWCSGPQIEFIGDQWQLEVQWSGFVDSDDNLYQNPFTVDIGVGGVD